MRFRAILTALFMITFTHAGFAHPPSNIGLQYDKNNGSLLINIDHLSRDHLEHYIHKIEISKNDGTPVTKRYHQQINPNRFFVEIPIKAEEDDLITVRAYSRNGGVKESTLELTKEALEAEIKRPEKPATSVSTIPKDKSKLKPAVPDDPEISVPAVPEDPDKYKPAVTRDPSIAKPAVATEPSSTRPAVTTDPDIAKPTIPSDPSKIKPASY